jgi:fucose 4-O-acetylase-like acetyltransferase
VVLTSTFATSAPATRARLHELDAAKGLAIFLVVLGHVVARDPPEGNVWYTVMKSMVYEFHMPFFMFLSGAVFFVTFARVRPGEATAFIRGRATRLLPAFFAFALIIWAAKTVGGQFLHVDNKTEEGLFDLLKILTRPSESVATSLWYIYVLFQLYVIFAVILSATRRVLWPSVVLATIATASFHIVQITNAFALALVAEFAVFFAIGMCAGKYYVAARELFVNHSVVWYGLFAFSFLLMLVVPHPLSKAAIGFFSIPAVFAFAATFRSSFDQRVLQTLGDYTFTIYLMNTLIIGGVKGVMLLLIPWDGRNFLLYFPVLLAAGLIGPILIHKWVLTKIPYIGRLTK